MIGKGEDRKFFSAYLYSYHETWYCLFESSKVNGCRWKLSHYEWDLFHYWTIALINWMGSCRLRDLTASCLTPFSQRDISLDRRALSSPHLNSLRLSFSPPFSNRAIALDPSEGYLYFTCWGLSPQLSRVSMAGGEIEVLVNKSIAWPNALAIDYVTKKVFFGDAHFDYIRFVMYEQKNKKKRLKTWLTSTFKW